MRQRLKKRSFNEQNKQGNATRKQLATDKGERKVYAEKEIHTTKQASITKSRTANDKKKQKA